MAFQKTPRPDATPESAASAVLPPSPDNQFRPNFAKNTAAKPKVSAQVLRRPSPAAQTEIPKELVEHFRNLGCQVHFVWADARLLSQESTYSRFPVQVEDLPEDIVKSIRPWFEDPAKHSGQLRRSDAVVVYQSLEAREAWRLDTFEQQRAREKAYLSQGDEIEHRLRAAGLTGTVDASRIVPLDKHMIGGPELMKMLAEDEDGADAAGSDS